MQNHSLDTEWVCLEYNATNGTMLANANGETDQLLIAERELHERVIPFVVRRYLPDGTYEDWKVKELMEISI